MAKNKVVEIEVEVTAEKVTPLTVDFGRADLNELRDKVNELVARS